MIYVPFQLAFKPPFLSIEWSKLPENAQISALLMICQLDTPLKNPSENSLAEVEVLDAALLLYIWRFPFISLSHCHRGSQNAMVAYKKDTLMRIPVSATSLSATN
jgi:hypothetical protein